MIGLYIFLIVLVICVTVENYFSSKHYNDKEIETLTNLIESVNKTNQELQERIDLLEQTSVETTTPKKSKIYKKKLY